MKVAVFFGGKSVEHEISVLSALQIMNMFDEKIDIIPWSENPLEFISRALSPARVMKVVQTGEDSAVAIVPDDKLSLAIGRSGQNVRLAVRLTGWKVDVKSQSAVIGSEFEVETTEEEI